MTAAAKVKRARPHRWTWLGWTQERRGLFRAFVTDRRGLAVGHVEASRCAVTRCWYALCRLPACVPWTSTHATARAARAAALAHVRAHDPGLRFLVDAAADAAELPDDGPSA